MSALFQSDGILQVYEIKNFRLNFALKKSIQFEITGLINIELKRDESRIILKRTIVFWIRPV